MYCDAIKVHSTCLRYTTQFRALSYLITYHITLQNVSRLTAYGVKMLKNPQYKLKIVKSISWVTVIDITIQMLYQAT